jgi:hypothetical protein
LVVRLLAVRAQHQIAQIDEACVQVRARLSVSPLNFSTLQVAIKVQGIALRLAG